MYSKVIVSLTLLMALVALCSGLEDQVIRTRINTFTLKSLESGNSFTRKFKQISDYLDSNRQYVPAMDALRKWLEETQKKSPRSDLVKALQLIVDLDNTIDKCDLKAYSNLYRSYTGLKSDIFKKKEEEIPFNALEELIYDYSVRHAKRCQSAYAEAYELKWNPINSILKYKALNVAAVNIGMHLHWLQSQLNKYNGVELRTEPHTMDANYIESLPAEVVTQYLEESKKYPCEHAWSNYLLPFEVISSIGKKTDPDYLRTILDKNNRVDKSKIKAEFKKNIVEPCEFHNREFGPIFIQADYDSKALDVVYQTDPKLIKFYIGWRTFYLCNQMIEGKSNLVDVAFQDAKHAQEHGLAGFSKSQ